MRRLAVHALLYGLVLAATTAVVGFDGSFGSDDGAYGGQVHALRNGSWSLDRPVPVVPAANEGWFNNAVTPTGPTPYTANPAYARFLATVAGLVHGRPPPPISPDAADTAFAPTAGPPDQVSGGSAAETAGGLSPGLHLPGLVAALASALVAWRLAGRWDRRAAPVAFWLLGLGPVLVNTTALWAHPLSTAFGGAAVLAVVELEARPGSAPARWGWRLVLVLSLASGVAVRSEAALFTLALVLGVLAQRRLRPLAPAVVAAGACTLVVALANRAWGRSLRADRLPIETGFEAVDDPGSWLFTRIPAAWQLLVTQPGTGLGTVLAVGAAAFAVHGALCLRRPAAERLAPVSLGAAAGLLLLRAALAPAEVITGVVAAWPLVAVGLLVGPGRRGQAAAAPDGGPDTDRPPLGPGWLMVSGALHLVAVVATQYGNSGGLQWGGRYLSMIYVPVAVFAALRLTARLAPPDATAVPASATATAAPAGRAASTSSPAPTADPATGPGPGPGPRAGAGTSARRGAIVTASALAVAPALAGVVASRSLHHTHAAVVAQVTNPPAEVVITELPALPRLAWTALPVAVYRADDATVIPLLELLADAGVATVNVQGSAGVELDSVAGYRVASDHNGIRHLTRTGADSADPVGPSGEPGPVGPPAGPGLLTPSREAPAGDP